MNKKSITSEEFYQKVFSVESYFYCEYENAVVRSVPTTKGADYYVKLKGKPEFKAILGSGIITQVRLDPVEISKYYYEVF